MISIIVPVYNVENYVRECLASLSAQVFRDFEVVIINDGSQDNSPAICAEFCEREPQRFRLFSQQNKGLSAARNLGLQKVRGEFVCFVDSDDWVAPEFLEKLFSLAQSENADLIACGYEAHYTNGKTENFPASDKSAAIQQNDTRRQVLLGQTFACNKMFATTLFATPDAQFTEGICYEDLGTIPLLVARAKKVAATDAPLYHYRIGRAGAITTFRNEKTLDIFVSLRRLKTFLPAEYFTELEWISIRSCVFRYALVGKFPNGASFQKQLRNFLYSEFPKWRKNTYLAREKNFRFRLKTIALALNLGWLFR